MLGVMRIRWWLKRSLIIECAAWRISYTYLNSVPLLPVNRHIIWRGEFHASHITPNSKSDLKIFLPVAGCLKRTQVLSLSSEVLSRPHLLSSIPKQAYPLTST